MGPITKWTLWQRRWSTLWWSVGVFSFIFVNLIFYPSFKDQAAQLEKSFSNIPDTAAKLIGGTDFFSPAGYLNSQLFFILLPLLLGILTISMASSLLAREEQDKTIELLMTKPITRTNLLAGKAIAGMSILSIVTLVSLATTIVVSKIVGLEMPATNIALATAVCFLMTLSFGSVAFLFTAIGKTKGASLGLASIISIGGYLISSLSGTVSWLKLPSKLFPFHYYNPEAILKGNSQLSNLYYFVGLIIICSVLSWLAFRKRDIY